jgi:hypothetical protein
MSVSQPENSIWRLYWHSPSGTDCDSLGRAYYTKKLGNGEYIPVSGFRRSLKNWRFLFLISGVKLVVSVV